MHDGVPIVLHQTAPIPLAVPQKMLGRLLVLADARTHSNGTGCVAQALAALDHPIDSEAADILFNEDLQGWLRLDATAERRRFHRSISATREL